MERKLIMRCEQFISELGLPVTRFCKNIDLSPTAYYSWRRGEMNMRREKQKEIDEYLKKYNF